MTILDKLRIYIDEQAGAVFFPEAQLLEAVNEALLQCWIDCPPTLTRVEVGIGADGKITIPVSAIAIPKYLEGIKGKQYFTSIPQMNAYSPGWRASTATALPTHFILLDSETILAYPRPDASYAYDLYGIGWPADLTSSIEDVTAPEAFKEAVAILAASVLLEHTMPNFGDVAAAEAARLLAEARSRNRKMSPLTLRPSTGIAISGSPEIIARIG